MKFEFTETEQANDEFRFGGELAITAENPQEVESLIDHFRLFKDVSDIPTLKARIEALESGSFTHVIRSEKRPVYAVESCLPYEFTAVYKQWALNHFGYDGTFPDLELPRKWGGLIHTNYQARLFTENEHICFEAFTTAEPWARRNAQDYAEYLISDYIGEEFGTRYHEPEFIPGRNGHYKKNPDYLKRHAAKPGATNARIKRAFFEWWLSTHATDDQKAIVEGNREIVAQTGPYMGAFEFERPESTIYHGRKLTADGKTHDYKAISFSDFAKMGA